MTTSYPLKWPDGWPRTPAEKREAGNQFKASGEKTRRELFSHLRQMKATYITVSSNIAVRGDGTPYADAARRIIRDPGVAVYFTRKGRQISMARDAFHNVEANLRSICLALEAMRALERHGGDYMTGKAFEGFAALPPPEGFKARRPWFEVMRFPKDPEEREFISVAEVEARWKALAKKLHPDSDGAEASDEAMAELNVAKQDAIEEIEGRPS